MSSALEVPEIPPELRAAFESSVFSVILQTGEVALQRNHVENIPAQYRTRTRLWAGTTVLRQALVWLTEDEELVEQLLVLMKQIGQVVRPGLSEEVQPPKGD